MLPAEWNAQEVYDNHELLMFHGQRCCFFRQPECERCVLLDLCPTGQARLATVQRPEKISRRGAETQRRRKKMAEGES
jgi:endonuclease-3